MRGKRSLPHYSHALGPQRGGAGALECNGVFTAWYRYSSVSVALAASERSGVHVVEGGVCFQVRRDLIEADASSGVLAEVVAGLLLAEPMEIEGSREEYERLARLYASRVAAEENHRLRRLLGRLLHLHAFVADIALLVMRMSRLARLYVWLRPLYNRSLESREGVAWLRGLAGAVLPAEARLWGPWYRATGLPTRKPRRWAGPGSARAAAGLASEMAGLELLRGMPREAVLEGLSTKPLPLLRDPLLLVRLDYARLATRLLGFEEQLYALTGVTRLIAKKRGGIIRSARMIHAEGFTAAVVKHYRDATLAKWLLAALLTLPLPPPRVRPRERLQAEYHYNRLLAEKGYHVPNPILVDPRRHIAAYTYIEGRDLLKSLQENPAPMSYYRLGRLLARLHRDGIALWDSNPSNILETEDGTLYLVDLEQAREADSLTDRAWDIAVATYYTVPYATTGAPERAALIARGYVDEGGDPQAVLEASKYKYVAPFLTASPLNVLEATRKTLARVATDALRTEPQR